MVLSSFTAPRGPLSPLGNAKVSLRTLLRFSEHRLKLNPYKADRNIFIKIIAHSQWSLHKMISIKIFQFAMQNYKYEQYSLYILNLCGHPLRSPAGKGDRGERWMRRAKSVLHIIQCTKQNSDITNFLRFIISEFLNQINFRATRGN